MNGVLRNLPEQGIRGGPTNCGILWQLPIRQNDSQRRNNSRVCVILHITHTVDSLVSYWRQCLAQMGSILVLPEDELSKRLLWDDWLLSWQSLTDGGPAIDWVLIFHATTKQLLIVVSKCAWPTESRNPSFCQYLNAEQIQHSSLVCTQQHKVEPMNNAGWYNVILSLMVARSWMVQMFRKTEYPQVLLVFC